MKKSDVVVINDGSFSRTVKNNKLTYGPDGDKYTHTKNSDRRQYVIIETGCSFPNTDGHNTFNNTVIQAVNSDKIVFIEERFLELKKLPIREVTMVEVCAQFGEDVKVIK